MSITPRSRRGTSRSFWRNHHATETMLIEACMPSIRTQPPVAKADRVQPVAPVWFPTPQQRERYQKRSNRDPLLPTAS